MFKRRFNLCLILATALAAIIIPQIAMSQEYLVDKVISLTAQAQGLPPRVAREIHVVAGTNQLLIYSTNTSGIPISAGSRITDGLVWRVAKHEL